MPLQRLFFYVAEYSVRHDVQLKNLICSNADRVKPRQRSAGVFDADAGPAAGQCDFQHLFRCQLRAVPDDRAIRRFGNTVAAIKDTFGTQMQKMGPRAVDTFDRRSHAVAHRPLQTALQFLLLQLQRTGVRR